MLVFLRHGETRANREGRWHGSTDAGLSWKGRQQAVKAARYVDESMPIAALYSSPLKRCRQTASVLGRKLGIDAVRVDALKEFGIGEWEDLSFQCLAQKHSFVATMTSDEYFVPPGGESLREVADRIVPALEKIQSAHDAEQRILIVGHAVTFAIALACILDGHPKHWTKYRLENCSLTELVLAPEPQMGLYNMNFHLV